MIQTLKGSGTATLRPVFTSVTERRSGRAATPFAVVARIESASVFETESLTFDEPRYVSHTAMLSTEMTKTLANWVSQRRQSKKSYSVDIVTIMWRNPP